MFGQAAGCLGSAVLCDARTVVGMPPGLTFAEAATIPTAFLTAYDCLRATARISKHSRVLVHAATGALNTRGAGSAVQAIENLEYVGFWTRSLFFCWPACSSPTCWTTVLQGDAMPGV